MLRNKRAAIGEAMTWITATVVIIVVLSMFLFASNLMATSKNVGVAGGDVGIEGTNPIQAKTETALEIKSSGEDAIRDWIEDVRSFEKDE